MRPRKVSVEDYIVVIKKYIVNGSLDPDKSKLPGPTKPIYKTIAKEDFSDKCTPRDVYREMRENRHRIWSRALEELNIVIETPAPPPKKKRKVVTSDSGSEIESDAEIISEDEIISNLRSVCKEELVSESDVSDWENENKLDMFILEISEDFYNNFVEAARVNYNGRKYRVLRRFGWTDDLAILIHKFTQSKCAFVFRHGKVYETDNSKYHINIKGRCRSKSCNNQLSATMDSKPKSFPAYLKIMCRDTALDDAHEDVQRPVRKKQAPPSSGCSGLSKICRGCLLKGAYCILKLLESNEGEEHCGSDCVNNMTSLIDN